MSKPAEGAWHGVNSDHYRTRGADCFRLPGIGWFARCQHRVRGPLSTLDAAMIAADRMLADARLAPIERTVEAAGA